MERYLYLLGALFDFFSLIFNQGYCVTNAVWLYKGIKDKNFPLVFASILALAFPLKYIIPYSIEGLIEIAIIFLTLLLFGMGFLEYNNFNAQIAGILYLLSAVFLYIDLPLNIFALLFEGFFLLDLYIRGDEIS